jgi:alkylated DNA repair dioxygenase AlkB
MLGSSVVKVLRDSNNKSSCTHLRGVVSDGLANDVLKELEGIELDNRTTAEMKASYPTQRCFSHDVYGEKRRSLSPRHVLALSLVGDGRAYPYAGQKRDAFDCKGLPAIVALMRLLSALFGVPLDFALVNRYDLAQGHHLNAHSDAEEDLVPGAPIVAVTLGVALPFEVTYGVKEQSVTDPSRKGYKIVQNGQPPAESERRTVTFLPKHGDVVIMHGALQQHYQHSIPKPPLGQQGIRYSITARALVRG